MAKPLNPPRGNKIDIKYSFLIYDIVLKACKTAKTDNPEELLEQLIPTIRRYWEGMFIFDKGHERHKAAVLDLIRDQLAKTDN